jgi:Uma2 family endonuclease
LRVRLWSRKYREPDLVFIATKSLGRLKGNYPDGADLVVEVVSGSEEDRERDLVTKRKEYAQARITEYWIVDPQNKRITVLHLEDEEYAVHGEFGVGNQATSRLLDGLAVAVDDVFAAAEK